MGAILWFVAGLVAAGGICAAIVYAYMEAGKNEEPLPARSTSETLGSRNAETS